MLLAIKLTRRIRKRRVSKLVDPNKPPPFQRVNSKTLFLQEQQRELQRKLEVLERVLSKPETRKQLVHALLDSRKDFTIKVRFCWCVMEMSNTCKTKIETEAKGSKIVSLFVENRSMFHCKGIPANIQDKLLNGDYAFLDVLKTVFLYELCESGEVFAKILKTDGVTGNDVL
jgi:hypothetical protein